MSRKITIKLEDLEKYADKIRNGYSKLLLAKELGICNKTLTNLFRENVLDYKRTSRFRRCLYCKVNYVKQIRSSFCGRECYRVGIKKVKNKDIHYLEGKIRSLRQRAKENNLEFNIDVDFLKSLWNKQKGKCFYTGTQLFLKTSRKFYEATSVDRLDNTKGYVKDNVVFCLNRINCMKSNLNKNEFVNTAKVMATLNDTSVSYYKHSDRAFTPTKHNFLDAGIDLRSSEDIFVKHLTTRRIPTELSIYIPPGYYGFISERSSIGALGLKVGGGIVDSLYTGKIDIILHNLTCKQDTSFICEQGYQIKRGDRVAQIIIQKCELPTLVETTELWYGGSRGDSGLGSSGK